MWEGLESLQGEARPLVLATEIWQRGMATLSFNFSTKWAQVVVSRDRRYSHCEVPHRSIPHVFIQAKFHTANVDRRAEWMPRGRGGEGSVMAVVSLLPSAAPGQGSGIRHFTIRKISPLLPPPISNNWGLF